MTDRTKDRYLFAGICICLASCSTGVAFMGWVCLYRLVAGVWP